MSKRFLTLLFLLTIPLFAACKQDNANQEENKQEQIDEFEGEAWEKAAPRVKDGDVVLANSELTQKFIAEVNYADKTYANETKIFDYYGGFGSKVGEPLTWSNWSKNWPDGDKPNSYSIRWNGDSSYGKLKLHLADDLGWAADTDIKAGACYVDITNLVPNDKYTFKVTAADGTVITEGKFSTTGNLHQVFFKTKCRNARDLGGWKTEDGKTIKYRKVYRGGRMNDPWETMLNATGKKEVLAEGIYAELELRGSDDFMLVPAVDEMDHCHPCIEEGGKVMLGVTKPSAKNLIKWLVLDPTSPWTEEQRVPYRVTTSHGYGYKLSDNAVTDITPTLTEQDYTAFQAAYKAKTKECFEFVANSVHAGKGCYFHCSLGRDRTGTMGVIIMGVLGVREGEISKEYELTYFAPVGFSVSSSDKETNTQPVFKNDRTHWVYSDIVPYFWQLAGSGSFASGVEKYLVQEAGVSQALIDQFRSDMLQ